MKPILTILFILSACIPAHASKRFAHQNVKVVTQFAVPIGVPVAIAAPVAYANSATPQYSGPPKSAEDILLDRLADLVAKRLAVQGGAQALEVKTMFSQKCATCHSQAKPDGRPVFGSLDTLTAEQRLAAIKSMSLGRMPKGSKLSPEDTAKLVEELLDVPEVKE